MTIQNLIDILNEIPKENRNMELVYTKGNGFVKDFNIKNLHEEYVGNYIYSELKYILLIEK